MSRTAGRLVLALIVALAVLVLGPASAALAQAPQLTIEAPEGTLTNNSTPQMRGTTDDSMDLVTVVIERVGGGGGATLTAGPVGEEWSISPAANLPDGEYTAHATQTNAAEEEGQSGSVGFTVDTAAPTLTLGQPPSPSNTTKPSFGGFSSDSTTVAVRIYSSGNEVTKATGSGGAGWTAGNENSLPTGTYTAQAEQTDEAGNTGTSNTVTFTIDTRSPVVVLNQPTTPSSNTKPTFSGTASDTETVVVEIFTAGSKVASATASGSGGGWSTNNEPQLAPGSYTAVATQASSLGNPSGKSSPVDFTIDTSSPVVVLNQPTTPSNNTKPTFSGTASDSTEVVVHVYNSAKAEVAKASAKPTAGSWKTGALSGLASGKNAYTVVATQVSSLGNPPGRSTTLEFEVNTLAPVVMLDPLVAHTNNATPSFSGTTNDTTRVTVKVFVVEKGVETLVATVEEQTTGLAPRAWTVGPATLKPGKHTYTAVATQKSSLLGNPEGKSVKVTFAVDTEAPAVTLNALASPTNNPSPSFTGTASERLPINIRIFKGPTIDGQLVAETSAAGTGAGWASGPASPALGDGEYVAVATQASAFGHEPGGASSSPFVLDSTPPQVNVTAPAEGSSTNSSSQLVEGTAGTAARDRAQVTVRLFTGSQIAAGQSPTQSIQVSANGGRWSATLAGLSPGSYAVRAEQADDAGNLGVSAATSFSVLAFAAAAQAGPSASFTWSPSAPHVGEAVSLLSDSTDPASPITAFAWDLSATGVFAGGGAVSGTSFSTPGQHVVRLRVTDAAGVSGIAAETIGVAASSVRLMRPFPSVRIVARGAGAGIRLKLLSVRAPAGARIAVGCSGKGCPVKSQSRIAAAGKPGTAPLEFRRFQRFLRPGVVLQVRISKPGEIGKYTRFVVRRGRLPARSDACIGSPAGKPIACPAS